jgi:hypothetical protein
MPRPMAPLPFDAHEVWGRPTRLRRVIAEPAGRSIKAHHPYGRARPKSNRAVGRAICDLVYLCPPEAEIRSPVTHAD